MDILLTGYTIQLMSLCELRGKLEIMERKTYKNNIMTPRRIVNVLLDKCGEKYCARRKLLSGFIKSTRYSASPDIILFNHDDIPIAVVKVTITKNTRPMRIYYPRLSFEGYAVYREYQSRPVLAVLAGIDKDALLRGLRYMIDGWELTSHVGEGFTIHTRYLDIDYIEKIINRIINIFLNIEEPRAKPGAACKYCTFRDTCPYGTKT